MWVFDGEVLGVDDDGVVVLVVAALAMALLAPKPTPMAAPDMPSAKRALAKRLLMFASPLSRVVSCSHMLSPRDKTQLSAPLELASNRRPLA